ncbi:FAD-dependent oxidoreductase [Chloroflexota bacterium]
MVEGRTHRPVIDTEKCDSCSVCIKGCPAGIIPEMRKEESSLRGRIYREAGTAVSLNIDKVFALPSCQVACPIHQDVRKYTNLIASKKYEEALAVIRENNALPSVCGYICHRPCEAECFRNLVDEPISIRTMKRFVADFDDGRSVPAEVSRKKREKVVIVGSGPAGLAAAYDLARIGYGVEVLEAYSEPGGMLRWAIPPFRLPRNILSRDISYIEKMGVTIKTSIKFGVDASLTELRKDDADAIIMAIGTHQGLKMGIKKEECGEEYLDCLTFLRKYNNGEPVDLGEKTVVVGGGNAAIDSVRSALRTGVKEAAIVYRRSYEEMPADRDEIEEAQAEGVKIHYLAMPVNIAKKDGKIQGLECVETRLGERDGSGRRKPVPVEGSEFTIATNSIISAIGQRPDLSWNREGLPFEFSPMNTFIVDDSCLTNIDGIFAAGDASSGPTTVVEAMASGRSAAVAVDNYLAGKGQSRS